MAYRTQTNRELLGAEVAMALRAQILNGEIKPGDQLVLNRLAERMGTSITPVREALLRLSQDGWLRHEAHRGFQVAPLSRESLRDTYFIWATVEGEIARRAANRWTKDEIAGLRNADAQLQELQDHHTELALTLNQNLHSLVHTASRSPKLVWFALSSMRSVPLHFSEVFQFVPGWEEINRYGHTRIVDAVEARDGPQASTLMRQHFLQAGNLLLEQLDVMNMWDD